MIATFKEMNPQLPIVAIGGINTSNVAPIVEAGANGSFQPFLKVKILKRLLIDSKIF